MKKVSIKEAKAKRASKSGAWKYAIAESLMGKQGQTCLEVYNAVRQDDRPDYNKIKSVQSEVTYLRNENYIVDVDDKKIFLVGVPNKDGKTVEIVDGQEDRYEAM